MALPKSEPKKIFDMVKADKMWKTMVKSEDNSFKNWQNSWGWILEEFGDLEKKLKEKTEESKFLTQILVEKKEDPRKLTKFPETMNHAYGWIAGLKEFQLDRFGPDMYKAKRLPKLYELSKNY